MFPLCSLYFLCHFCWGEGKGWWEWENLPGKIPSVNQVMCLLLAQNCVVKKSQAHSSRVAQCRVGAVFQQCFPTARPRAQHPLVSQTSVPSSCPRLITFTTQFVGGKRSLSYFWIPWHSRFHDRNRHIWGKIMSALVKGVPSRSRFSPLLLLCTISTAFSTVVVLSHLKRALLLPVFLKNILPLECLSGSVS